MREASRVYKTHLKKKSEKRRKIVHFEDFAIRKMKESYDEKKERCTKSSYERNFSRKRERFEKRWRALAFCVKQKKSQDYQEDQRIEKNAENNFFVRSQKSF